MRCIFLFIYGRETRENRVQSPLLLLRHTGSVAIFGLSDREEGEPS